MKGRMVKKGAAILIFLLSFSCLFGHLAQGEERDTFSISLVQQATVKRVKGREVIYEQYKVKKGDYIWRILRERGLLKRPALTEILSLLKTMNKSLTNLDLIHPGQTILIPLNIKPARGYGEREEFFEESIMGISSLKDIDFEDYVVEPGDCLTMVARDKYKVPRDLLYREYLELVQKFNPTLKDLDVIYPNQVIRLPIFSPEIVRMPIEAKRATTALKETKIAQTEDTSEALALRQKLKDIFDQMGEEWIDTGEQFIPLKSGAQINLKADSFPILNLRSGKRLIIDLRDELPGDICQLIESDWEDFRVVHLTPDDDLEIVIDTILAASDYHKILRSGEHFRIGGDIGISIAGDWVIIPRKGERDVDDNIAVINLINSHSEKTSGMVTAYLGKLGIKVIDHPDFSAHEDTKEGTPVQKKIEIEKDLDFPLPGLLLNLTGQPFSSRVKIPMYKGESSKFNLIIQADLFFNRKGKDCIIDLTGLSTPIGSLLEKHQFLVLSLAGEKDPSRMTEQILDFLGLPFDPEPHQLFASARDQTRTIALSIPGISFHDHEGRRILATDTKMPREIVSFLNQKGYNLLELSQFQDKGQGQPEGG